MASENSAEKMRAFLLISVFLLTQGMNPPKNFKEVECSVNKFTETFATKRVPADELHFVHDALNVDQLCSAAADLSPDSLSTNKMISLLQSMTQHELTLPTQRLQHQLLSKAGPQFFIALDGSDSNSGSMESPFASFKRAQQATRSSQCTAASVCTIFFRQGKYYLGDLGGTMELSVADSNLMISAYNDERVILSGATKLHGLEWSSYPEVPGAYMAMFR